MSVDMMEPETVAAPGYPTAEHKNFYRSTVLPKGLHAHTGGTAFQQGMSSVVHRHRIASEASVRFADLVSDDPPTARTRATKLTQSCSFLFAAAVAATESASWALHGPGCVFEPGVFPMVVQRDLRGISPESTANRFGHRWPRASDPFSKALHQVVNSEDFKDLLRRRNHLSHRTIPRRNIHVTIHDPGSNVATRVDWDDLPLTPELSASRLTWLTTALCDLWVAGTEFMVAREADQSWLPAGD